MPISPHPRQNLTTLASVPLHLMDVVLLSKGDFSPFMMRLLPCESHPNAGNSIREGTSAIDSARLGRPRSLIIEAQKSARSRHGGKKPKGAPPTSMRSVRRY